MEMDFTGKRKGKGRKKDTHTRIQESVKGGYEGMIKKRKAEMGHIEKEVNTILKDYDGEMLAIIRITEDENGKPEATHAYIGGVASIEAQLKMGKALSEAADNMRDILLDAVKGDPKMISSLLGSVVEGILDERDHKDCDHN